VLAPQEFEVKAPSSWLDDPLFLWARLEETPNGERASDQVALDECADAPYAIREPCQQRPEVASGLLGARSTRHRWLMGANSLEAWALKRRAGSGDTVSMVELGIVSSGLRADTNVNLWRLAARDELPKPYPKVKDFPGWWDGCPRVFVLRRARNWWQSAAELGYPRAMTLLGCVLTGADDLAGRQWLERASDLGDLDALFHLGLSWGAEGDKEQTLSLCLEAANRGHVGAMWACGSVMVADDVQAGMRWYAKAAEKGDVIACYDLACMAERGRLGLALGTTVVPDSEAAPDYVAAERFHRTAADKGYPPAMYRLGLRVLERDPSEAQRLWVESSARGYHPSALKLAVLARKGQVRGGPWSETNFLQRAADLGNGHAAYCLGAGMPGFVRNWYWRRARELGVDPADQPRIRRRWPWQSRDIADDV